VREPVRVNASSGLGAVWNSSIIQPWVRAAETQSARIALMLILSPKYPLTFLPKRRSSRAELGAVLEIGFNELHTASIYTLCHRQESVPNARATPRGHFTFLDSYFLSCRCSCSARIHEATGARSSGRFMRHGGKKP
jgi:hypothetical protein